MYPALLFIPSFMAAILAAACIFLLKRTRILKKADSQAPVKPYISPEMVAEDDISVTGNLLCDNHQAICDNLMDYFEKEKPYLNPNIKIVDVAEQLNTNKSYLSRIINSHFKKNFSQFINWYRIRDAMDNYVKNPSMDITTMANKSGFQSMTTFNTAFTRYTGMTPGEWCKKYKNVIVNETGPYYKKNRKVAKSQTRRADGSR